MKRNTILSLLFLCFGSTVISNTQTNSNNVLYVYGFTGRPEASKTMIPAILPDSNIIAPIMPDTKPVTDYGLNKLINIAASFWGKNVNRMSSDLGHDKDIEAIASVIPEKPFIAFGVCRGGSALINTIAKHNPQHLQALVIDGSYASLPKTFYGFLSSCGISTTYAESLVKLCFPLYKKGSASPEESIALIKDKNLPILLLHSKDDATIPFAHAYMFYKAFKDNGFKHVYLATVNGKHSYSLQADPATYLTAVHSFYKKHNLPYHAEHATANMNSYVPDMQKVNTELGKYYQSIEDQITSIRKKLSISTAVIAASYIAYKKL
jgi:fermentation-respiration switch protein FrsA (DUF1100 family)